MHPTRSFTLSCLAFVMLLGLGGQAFANNLAVGLCPAPGTHYTTIGAAVTAAATGDTIRVCPDIYREQVTINKSLTLIGIASGTSDAAVVVPPASGLAQNGVDIFGFPVAAQIFVSNATAVTVSSLTVDGTGNNIAGCGAPTLEGIYFQNASGKIIKNAVRNQFQTDFVDYGGCQNGLAINVESTTASNTVTVSNNSVRAYQKNGITATGAATGPGSVGPAVTISANYIVGMAAMAMNWPGGAAENGIQVGFGASGTVSGNTVNDNIWYADTSSQPYNAASGILVYSSDGITISGNSVGSAQFGITAVTDPPSSTFCNGAPCGPADNTTITSNKVSGTQIFDAIDVCSNSNTVKLNTIYGSAESGVHVDDSCGSGNNNSVTSNSINEACAGILLGTGTGTTFSPNVFLNVTNSVLAGDTCTPPYGPVKQHHSLRPSPYKK
jgi:nitrous oxidase accessory protein